MKTNQLYLLAGLLLALLTTLPHAALAQVKIGNNYTTIGSTSNLEVEATNGKKVIVNKADGSMVIETTPTSTSASDLLLGVDATGKVVTVNRVNIVNSVTATGSVGVAPYIRAEGSITHGTVNPTNPKTFTGLTTLFSNLITYNSTTGEFTVPSTGYYFYAINTSGQTVVAGTTSQDHCTFFQQNGVTIDATCSRATSIPGTATVTGLYKFDAGDLLKAILTTASNVSATGTYGTKISLYKLSD